MDCSMHVVAQIDTFNMNYNYIYSPSRFKVNQVSYFGGFESGFNDVVGCTKKNARQLKSDRPSRNCNYYRLFLLSLSQITQIYKAIQIMIYYTVSCLMHLSYQTLHTLMFEA